MSLEARDIRFPTSRWLDGSDAMHTDPDYSAAYIVLRTEADDGLEGHGLTFTSGRGTEVCASVLYEPPAGRVGQLVLRLLGEEPRQTLSRHLHRLRQILEAGEIATIEGQPSGRVERAAREQKEQPVAHGSVEEPRS